MYDKIKLNQSFWKCIFKQFKLIFKNEPEFIFIIYLI
jgi:hypothetical protein